MGAINISRQERKAVISFSNLQIEDFYCCLKTVHNLKFSQTFYTNIEN